MPYYPPSGSGETQEGTTGTSNTTYGDNAGDSITSGAENTFVGVNAGTGVTDGSSNTALGFSAMSAAVSPEENVAVGTNALASLVSNTRNTAVGYNALTLNTSSNATAVGHQALDSNTTGLRNTAVGSQAAGGISTNSDITAIGYNALILASGGTNTAVGSAAGNSLSTGTANTFLGYNADSSSATGTNRTAIGANALCESNNSIRLGDAAVTLIDFDGTLDKTIKHASDPTVYVPGAGVAKTLTIKASNANLSSEDSYGGDLILETGYGTGYALSSKVRTRGSAFSDNPATTTTPQALINRSIVGATTALTDNTATSILSCAIASNTVIAGKINYAVQASDGTDFQIEEGSVSFHATNKAGTIANNVTNKFGNQQAVTAGTLTVTFTITAANPAVLQVNANTSFSAGTLIITFNVENLTQQEMTPI